jgi:antitoxin YefM
MPVETTYSALREKLASYLDQVTDDREVVIVRRRGARDVALIPAEELAGLMETAHLLRSPKNAERLLRALHRATRGEGKAETVEDLRRSVGLDPLG